MVRAAATSVRILASAAGTPVASGRPPQATMDAMDNAALIDRLRGRTGGGAGCARRHGADELDRRPAPGAWTARRGRPPPGGQRDDQLPPAPADAGHGSPASSRTTTRRSWAAEPRLAYDGPIEPPLAVLDAVRAATTVRPPPARRRRLRRCSGVHPEHDGYSVQLWLWRSTPPTPTSTPTRSGGRRRLTEPALRRSDGGRRPTVVAAASAAVR